jgi:fructosamine-3-kinase
MQPDTLAILSNQLQSLGIDVLRLSPIAGGDINEAFKVYTNDTPLFLKLNDAMRFPQMFGKECDGLRALAETAGWKLPRIILQGSDNKMQWLVLEWLVKQPAHSNSMYQFGQVLAHTHQREQSFYGWKSNNFIGSLEQVNDKKSNWVDFFVDCRIRPMLDKLLRNGSIRNDEFEKMTNTVAAMAINFPEEPPALLHGDLWSGNFMITTDGKAAVFDPAVYFGHREMDIGMTLLFGGFDTAFYKGYESVYPLQTGWQQRIPLTQLYPLLVHAVLFGGHYISQALSIAGL